MNTIDEGLKPMTLATVADGALEAQFQERQHEAIQYLADYRRLECTADGKQRVTITCEIEIELDVESGTFHHSARAKITKRPAPLKIRRAAYRRDSGFKVKPEIQESLPLGDADSRH